jgi:hypothetical protein
MSGYKKVNYKMFLKSGYKKVIKWVPTTFLYPVSSVHRIFFLEVKMSGPNKSFLTNSNKKQFLKSE